jgi:hypothetical protein
MAGFGVAQHRRLDRRGGGDGRLQQVGVEGQQCWPAPVVPSGNTATVSPARSASAIWCTTRSASRLRSRSMNSVPAAATSQPSSGQRRTSALETKRACGHTACTA